MKAVENDRLLREAAALAEVAEAHHRAEAEARQLEANNRVARVVADEAARKADRDRRYAARKVRRAWRPEHPILAPANLHRRLKGI